ncbi:nucleolar zinc-finger protein [Xylographa opegraphella]|nr:nucleolar zinc-finger protein [Xylographa opegraphella]
MQDDRESCRREEEEERAEQRAKLFLPVGEKVGGFVINEEDIQGSQLVEEIESLCMNCEGNGITRLLLTKIPYFREIILMSFFCEHCHFRNTEVQSAGEIQEKGAKYTLKMDSMPDMERQMVKSDSAILKVEELDLEIPAGRGRLTNVEGILAEILRDLEDSQKGRKREYPELYEKIDMVVQSLLKYMMGQRFPYTISLDDPAGNSWIEPSPLDSGGKYTRTEYSRSPEQNQALGLRGGESEPEVKNVDERMERLAITEDALAAKSDEATLEDVNIVDGQVYELPCRCPGCGGGAAMNITMVKIPYFKEVILTAIVCPQCGYRTSDVKTGGEFPQKGQRIWLDVENATDLTRDILKSETCCLKIPACSVEVQPGTMGGRFTTVEGLLTQVRDDLRGAIFDTDDVDSLGGDSMPPEQKSAWASFFDKINSAIRGEMRYTILMEDPLANSYVQSFTAPEPDPQIRTEEYTRNQEEDEELGLTDMRTHLDAEGQYVKEIPGRQDASHASALVERLDGSSKIFEGNTKGVKHTVPSVVVPFENEEENLPKDEDKKHVDMISIEDPALDTTTDHQRPLQQSESKTMNDLSGTEAFSNPNPVAVEDDQAHTNRHEVLLSKEDSRTHSAKEAEAPLTPVLNPFDNNGTQFGPQAASMQRGDAKTHAATVSHKQILPGTETEPAHVVAAGEPLIIV